MFQNCITFFCCILQVVLKVRNYQNRLKNATEEYKAILKYKTKTNSMSKSSSKISNENKQGMLFWLKFAQKGLLVSEF